MLSHSDLAVYERLIHKRFPFATVIPDDRFEEYGNSICALGIPDERAKEFFDYLCDEIAPAIEALGIEQVAVLDYSREKAEKLFPEACGALPV